MLKDLPLKRLRYFEPSYHHARTALPRIILALTLAIGLVACTAPGTAPAPMDISRMRPFQIYPAVQRFAGNGAGLQEIRIKFIKSDGTLDLNAAYRPTLSYHFVRRRPNAKGLPLGAGGGARFEKVRVSIGRPGFRLYSKRGSRLAYPASFKPMVKTVAGNPARSGATTGPPACKLKTLWAGARAAGAPAGAVARINYGPAGYSFRIDDTRVRLYFDKSCQPIGRREYRSMQVESRRR